jgi:hypothetical protein
MSTHNASPFRFPGSINCRFNYDAQMKMMTTNEPLPIDDFSHQSGFMYLLLTTKTRTVDRRPSHICPDPSAVIIFIISS